MLLLFLLYRSVLWIFYNLRSAHSCQPAFMVQKLSAESYSLYVCFIYLFFSLIKWEECGSSFARGGGGAAIPGSVPEAG